MQKLKMGAMKGIENHNERKKESRTNPDIDKERSHLNRDMLQAPDDRTYYRRVKERISELHLPKAVRKDAVVAVGFIATSDKAFFDGLNPDQTEKFFQASNDFLKDRYGKKNVIASKVHMDEHTPHLHTYIVPVTEDGRLSAKSIFTRKELKSLQVDYHKHMVSQGFDLEKGEATRGHIEMAEFKKQTAFAKIKELDNEIDALVKQKNALISHLNAVSEHQSDLDQLKALKTSNTLLGKVKIEQDDFEQLMEQAKQTLIALDQADTLRAESDLLREDNERMKALISQQRESSSASKKTIEDLSAKLDKFKKNLDFANEYVLDLGKRLDLDIPKDLGQYKHRKRMVEIDQSVSKLKKITIRALGKLKISPEEFKDYQNWKHIEVPDQKPPKIESRNSELER